jgi:hypothetical protein
MILWVQVGWDGGWVRLRPASEINSHVYEGGHSDLHLRIIRPRHFYEKSIAPIELPVRVGLSYGTSTITHSCLSAFTDLKRTCSTDTSRNPSPLKRVFAIFGCIGTR